MSHTIALIAGPSDPPRFAQGLGLPYLAAVLETADFAPRIFDVYPLPSGADDASLPDERLAAGVARCDPLLVGVTIHTPNLEERIHLAKCLRAQLPDTLLVAGGHHPSAEPAHLLRHSDFDVCVIGEGEQTLLDLALRMRRGEGRRGDDWLASVRGVAYLRGGRVVRTRPRPLIADLDSLPFPAHHLLGLADYAPHPVVGIRSTALVTYRGCPEPCVFCLNPLGHRVRLRGPDTVAEEMARVVGEHDVRGFNVYDNLFGLRRDHALAVCEEIIRRRLNVIWDSWTAGDLVDAELTARMGAAGCVRAGFGAESGDDEVLARARRGFTVEQHRAGIHALRSAGLAVQVFLMVGLPGESEASVRRTVDFAASCGADSVCLSLHRPYPGTPVWRNPRAFGVRITRGPHFEAYIETEHLSRGALLESVERAREVLLSRGMPCDVLRCDQYAWERGPASDDVGR